MKKSKLIFILLTFILMITLLTGCFEKYKDAKTEELTDATMIQYYLDKAKEEGFEYYSFIDLRAYQTTSGDYGVEYSYVRGRIALFDNAAWSNGSSKGQERVLNIIGKKKYDYPIILIDYDGSFVKDVADFLNEKKYTNVKYFKYGYFDKENGYIAQLGEAYVPEVGEIDCDC